MYTCVSPRLLAGLYACSMRFAAEVVMCVSVLVPGTAQTGAALMQHLQQAVLLKSCLPSPSGRWQRPPA